MPDRRTTTDASAAPDRPRRARAVRPPGAAASPAPEPLDVDGQAPAADGHAAADGPGPAEPAEPAETAEAAEAADEREAFPGWPPRDFLSPFVLLAVSLQRAHGYAIEDLLRGFGLFGITMSTLYRTLRQMEKDGFLESVWEPGPTGPARRMYTITDAGDAWLESSAAMLNVYRETIDRFFGLYDAGPGARRRQPDEPTGEKETRQ